MSYQDYKKMMIDDIKEDPEWYFDLLEYNNKRIQELTLLSDQKVNQYFREFIIKRYQKLLGDSLEKTIEIESDGYLWAEKELDQPGQMVKYSELKPGIKKDVPYLTNEFEKWDKENIILAVAKVGDNARSLLNKNQYEIFDLIINKGLNDEDISKLKGVRIRNIQNSKRRIIEKLSNAVEDELLKEKE